MYVSQAETPSPALLVSCDDAVTRDGETEAERLLSRAETARAEGRFELADEFLIMAWEAYEKADCLES